MKKIFEKRETLFSILLIIAYVMINSYCIQNFGTTNYKSAIINTIFSLILVILIIVLKRTKYYNLTKINDYKKYLFFIPLILIATVNI